MADLQHGSPLQSNMFSAGFLKPLPFVSLVPYGEENGIFMLLSLMAAGINYHSQVRTQ